MESSPLKVPEFMAAEINLWAALKYHWLPSALLAGAVFAGLAFKTLRQPGIYRSEALIVVGNQVAVPIVQGTQAQNQDFAKNLPTEIEILQSPSLLNRAIAKLSPAYRSIPVWEIQGKLSLNQPKEANILAVAYEDTNAPRAKAILDAVINTYIAYSEESRRSPVANAIKFIEERLPSLQDAVNRSSNALTDFRTRNTLDDPDQSVALAYTAKEQLQQSINAAQVDLNQMRETYQALSTQMAQAGQNPDTSLSDTVLSQNTSYQSVLRELNQIEVQYKLGEARYNDNHPVMKELRLRRDELRKILATEGERALGNKSINPQQNPEFGEIQQDLAQQLLQYRINIAAQEKRVKDLQQQFAAQNVKLQGLLKLQQQYRELNRQYILNAQNLDGFLSKLQELRLQDAQDTVKWKVIEAPSLPTAPIASSGSRGLVPGAIAGGLAGIALAYFLEKIDGRLKELEEIRKVTDLPILGTVPHAQKATAVGLQASDSFTEAIRSLALALSFQSQPGDGQVIAVTSAIAREGKTTITYNLGLALAELNKRVLIVDANLAYPSLHQVFGLGNSQGLVTAIATDRPWQELVQPPYGNKRENLSEGQSITSDPPEVDLTDPQNGYTSSSVFARVSTATALLTTEAMPEPLGKRYPDILTAGFSSTTASFPWLVSSKMQQLLDEWRKVYDYVLIDTSDISGLADVQSLASRVDQVLLVVSLMRVEREQLSDALQLLFRNNSQKVSVVVNTPGAGKGKREAYVS